MTDKPAWNTLVWFGTLVIIVIQTSIGGTIAQAVERLIGTMVGAAAGAVAVYAQEATGADVMAFTSAHDAKDVAQAAFRF